MPVNGLTPAEKQISAGVQDVRFTVDPTDVFGVQVHIGEAVTGDMTQDGEWRRWHCW